MTKTYSPLDEIMELLPEPLCVLVWEYAGGRPVHPAALLMQAHFEETRLRLDGAPSFWNDPAWDLVRACCMHKVTRRGPVRRGRTKKCTLPPSPLDLAAA